MTVYSPKLKASWLPHRGPKILDSKVDDVLNDASPWLCDHGSIPYDSLPNQFYATAWIMPESIREKLSWGKSSRRTNVKDRFTKGIISVKDSSIMHPKTNAGTADFVPKKEGVELIQTSLGGTWPIGRSTEIPQNVSIAQDPITRAMLKSHAITTEHIATAVAEKQSSVDEEAVKKLFEFERAGFLKKEPGKQ
jgi:hypothetical protein